MLLWCAVCVKAACSNETVCLAIQNGSETECPHDYPIIYKLSDLEVNGTNCKFVHIYLTSGVHILHVDLNFNDSVQETEIHGAPHGPPSIVKCQNNSGIRFSENESANMILISNVMFLSCQRFGERNLFPAALYLKNAVYTLSGVTVKDTDGWGLYVDNCSEQIIFNCTFSSNEENAFLGTFFSSYMSNVLIANSTFTKTKSFGAIILSYKTNNTIVLQNNIFSHNIEAGLYLEVTDRSFANNSADALQIDSSVYVVLQNNTFSRNKMSGLHIQDISDAEITGCSFANNGGDALKIAFSGHGIAGYRTVRISKVNFFSNYRAITLDADCIDQTIIVRAYISECIFTNHTGFEVIAAESSGCLVSIVLENSSIQGNKKLSGADYRFCIILDIQSINNFTLSDIDITDNDCTGIRISESNIIIQNSVNLTRNHGLGGGGIYISDFSKIIFAKFSKLSLINNTAVYGGGIYTKGRTSDDCFFGFEDDNSSDLLVFSGNFAEQGGDAMFGDGLFDCNTSVDGNDKILNMYMCSQNSPFWDFVSSTNIVSQSTFAEEPTRVMFCTNATSYENSSSSDVSCSDTDSISVYRGQTFTVSLMLTDDCCFPTIGLIEAKLKHSGRDGESPLQFKHGTTQMSRKYCDNFSYTLVGGLGQQEMTATVEFVLLNSHYLASPAILRVHMEECPIGFEINTDHEYGECSCKDKLKAYKIECRTSNVSLKIPAHTWVGVMNTRSGSIAVQNGCQYCKSKEVELIITKDSNLLCTANRAGVMCGACVAGYSLQLGGYECADCSNFTYEGVLLLIAFTVIGIALVLLLLGLNLTVSTGMINGLIFYSNMVYLNSDTLLPITREGNSTHLQNTVTILSTFLAWMNLDFGIVTCFFDGYDTYISTWMQFVFPLYIWLLVLISVLASRCSYRISKITPSNAVSVLATLLLLSYAKLLKTSIEGFSSVQLQLLDGNMTNKLWKPDANIPYLGQLHLPLFLMSLLIVVIYIVPFTLLILLGPLLQATSHYRVFNWINKLKPFLDAFYGPYTSRYRYWPGILLLSRLVILIAFAIYSYSPNYILLKLLTILVMSMVLFVLWMVIGKINVVSLNEKKPLNYLELFLLLNLSVLSSFYASSGKTEESQRGLAVAMVGSVLAFSCGIVGYQIFLTFSKFKAVRKLIPVSIAKRKNNSGEPQNPSPKQEDISTKTTHSLVEITECSTPNDELREPLLTSGEF